MSYSVYFKIDTSYTYTNEGIPTAKSNQYDSIATLDSIVNTYRSSSGGDSLDIYLVDGVSRSSLTYTDSDSEETVLKTQDLVVSKYIAEWDDDKGTKTDVKKQIKLYDVVKETIHTIKEGGKVVKEVVTVEILELDDLSYQVEVKG